MDLSGYGVLNAEDLTTIGGEVEGYDVPGSPSAAIREMGDVMTNLAHQKEKNTADKLVLGLGGGLLLSAAAFTVPALATTATGGSAVSMALRMVSSPTAVELSYEAAMATVETVTGAEIAPNALDVPRIAATRITGQLMEAGTDSVLDLAADGVQQTLRHGTSDAGADSIRAGIRVDVNQASSGRQQLGAGFYLTDSADEAAGYAAQAAGSGAGKVVEFADVKLADLGEVLDLTQGPGRAKWDKFLDEDLGGGISFRKMFELSKNRGSIVNSFLTQNDLNPDVLIGGLTGEARQIVIRSDAAAARLQAHIVGK